MPASAPGTTGRAMRKAMRFIVTCAPTYWPWTDSMLRADMYSSSVNENAAMGRVTAAYSGRIRSPSAPGATPDGGTSASIVP